MELSKVHPSFELLVTQIWAGAFFIWDVWATPHPTCAYPRLCPWFLLTHQGIAHCPSCLWLLGPGDCLYISFLNPGTILALSHSVQNNSLSKHLVNNPMYWRFGIQDWQCVGESCHSMFNVSQDRLGSLSSFPSFLMHPITPCQAD
jgi:hypothetical protein